MYAVNIHFDKCSVSCQLSTTFFTLDHNSAVERCTNFTLEAIVAKGITVLHAMSILRLHTRFIVQALVISVDSVIDQLMTGHIYPLPTVYISAYIPILVTNFQTYVHNSGLQWSRNLGFALD